MIPICLVQYYTDNSQNSCRLKSKGVICLRFITSLWLLVPIDPTEKWPWHLRQEGTGNNHFLITFFLQGPCYFQFQLCFQYILLFYNKKKPFPSLHALTSQLLHNFEALFLRASKQPIPSGNAFLRPSSCASEDRRSNLWTRGDRIRPRFFGSKKCPGRRRIPWNTSLFFHRDPYISWFMTYSPI